MNSNPPNAITSSNMMSGPRAFIGGGWSIIRHQDAKNLSYSFQSMSLSLKTSNITIDGLQVTGSELGGYVRVESEINAPKNKKDFPALITFVIGSSNGQSDGVVSSIEIVRRSRGGKLKNTVLTVAKNFVIPPHISGREIVLTPEDQDILREVFDEIFINGYTNEAGETLHIDFVFRSSSIGVNLAQVDLVMLSDIEASVKQNGFGIGEIGSNREPNAPVDRQVTSYMTSKRPSSDSTTLHPANTDKDVKAIKAEITDLEHALWGGYSQLAKDKLLQITKSKLTHPEARVHASWQLARWFSVKGQFEKVVSLLKDIRSKSKSFTRNKAFRLLEINALLNTGDLEAASKRSYDAISARPADNDYRLMAANIAYFKKMLDPNIEEDMDNQRVTIFNEMFQADGLLPISLAQKNAPLDINKLHCDIGDRYVTNGPKISVLMAAYDAEDHLHLAVESVINQTWRNIELIIVDDCSQDSTWERIKHYATIDNRIRIFRSDQNQGAYITRNIALDHATGEFITVHDSDDWSHPEMLSAQMRPFLDNDQDVIATFSMMSRVTPDLRFGIRPSRRNLEIVHRSYPSLLVRRTDLVKVGKWDGVRANADAEMVARLRDHFGAERMIDVLPNTPLSFFLIRPESLTEQGDTSLLSLTFGVRHEYDRQAEYMRSKWAIDGAIPSERVNKKVPFASPQLLLPYHMRPDPQYDIVLVSDLTLRGGTRGCNLGYIDAAVAKGYRVALFHWPRGDLRLVPDIDHEYRKRNQSSTVDIITCEEHVSCEMLVLHHPPVMKYMLDRVPHIVAKHGVILVNQLPYQLEGDPNIFYEPLLVERDFRKIFGISPLWAPISALVRRHLSQQNCGLHMTADDWLPPINVPVRDLPKKDHLRQPVIGRHARDHWTKWPERVEHLAKAYLVDTEVSVRLLGGAVTPIQRLGSVPKNWEVLEFDSIPILEFIDSLDFIVHFPHAEYIEEFGRNVAEAMARGIPAILPPVFRETFHDSAIYCDPQEVQTTVKKLWGDPDAYNHYAISGQNFVRDNCHLKSVHDRFANFLQPSLGGENARG